MKHWIPASLVAAFHLPAAAAQTTGDEPVRISIATLCDAGAEHAPLRFWPAGDARPLTGLGSVLRDTIDPRLLDLTASLAMRRHGRESRPRVAIDGADLVASGGAVDRDEMRDTMRDAVAVLAPTVSLEAGIWRDAPAPPAVLAADVLERSLPGAALCSARLECAAGCFAAFDLEGPGDERLRLRVEPHTLADSARVALLCEFSFEQRGRDGAKRWTAGTASGVVEANGGLALVLLDRIVVIRARPETRDVIDMAGVSWSLLTTHTLRERLEWTEDGGLERVAGTPLANADELLAQLRERACPDWWNVRNGISGDPTSRCLLLTGAPERFAKAALLVVEALHQLEEPWTETALVEFEVPARGHRAPSAVLRVPVLSGRTAAVLHTTWPAQDDQANGACVTMHWNAGDGADGGHASGWAIGLHDAGAQRPDGKPIRFDAFPLVSDGPTPLVEAAHLRVGLSRAGTR